MNHSNFITLFYSELINYRFSCVSIFIAENQHYAKIYTFPVVGQLKMPVKYDNFFKNKQVFNNAV